LSLWDIMKQIDVASFTTGLVSLGKFAQFLRSLRNFGVVKIDVPPELVVDRLGAAQAIFVGCQALGLTASLQMSERVLSRIRDWPAVGDFAAPLATQFDILADEIEHLTLRVQDELAATLMLVIDFQKQEFFKKTDIFGAEVDAAFPSAAFEIDEAGKCYALERSTACAFHLMRALEIAIKAIGKCLNIPDPVKDADRNWGAMLRKVKDEMDRRNRLAQWTRVSDREFFAAIHVTLDAVRNVWRNATMHVENKYTLEEAEHILGAVRGFMRKLASRMDELGQPLA
jgi:hypothetical protein